MRPSHQLLSLWWCLVQQLASCCTRAVAAPVVTNLAPPTQPTHTPPAVNEVRVLDPGLSGMRLNGIKRVAHLEPGRVGVGRFSQRLDHRDGGNNATFSQRYWYDATSWKGEGYPIFLFNAGETDAQNMVGYLQNRTLPGLMADVHGGAVIVIEHRYFGESLPFDKLTPETLQYLNLPNAIRDMTHFARTAELPFANKAKSFRTDPNRTPWVLLGGSYSGALTAWTQQLDGGVFAAYHGSSAVVQAQRDFADYFTPIAAALPAACLRDVHAAVAAVDAILDMSEENPATVVTLKKRFGLPQLSHNADFVERLADPLWKWQKSPDMVHGFCQYLANHTDADTGNLSGGVAPGSTSKMEVLEAEEIKESRLGRVLTAYASYINNTGGEYCRKYNCDSYAVDHLFNQPFNIGGDRQWNWMLCNEPFGWWQVGPPVTEQIAASKVPSIVSRHLTGSHWQRRCDLWFPPALRNESTLSSTSASKSDASTTFKPWAPHGSSQGFSATDTNRFTRGGWAAPFKRITFVNGGLDPWLGVTVAAPGRPGGPLRAGVNADAPTWLLPQGGHVPELDIDFGNKQLWEVVMQVIGVHGRWLREWRAERGIVV